MDLEEGITQTGVMHAATASPPSIERFEQFVSLKRAGWCLLLVELYVFWHIDFLHRLTYLLVSFSFSFVAC